MNNVQGLSFSNRFYLKGGYYTHCPCLQHWTIINLVFCNIIINICLANTRFTLTHAFVQHVIPPSLIELDSCSSVPFPVLFCPLILSKKIDSYVHVFGYFYNCLFVAVLMLSSFLGMANNNVVTPKYFMVVIINETIFYDRSNV